MKRINDGEIYDYIDSKTARLQKDRSHSVFRMLFLWALAVALWLSSTISGGEAIAIGLIGSAWASIEYSLCNIHVDTLHALDRGMKAEQGSISAKSEVKR